MKVSVVIPVYNRSDLLFRALDSVYAQSRPADEVIVVDDGSNREIYTRIQAQYPQTLCVRQPHAGVSRARNHGVELAQGDWIAFLDSDDEWHPQKLSQQMTSLSKSGLQIGHTDEIWIRNGVRVNPHNKHKKYGGDIFIRCLPLCLISPSSVLINKDLFQAMGGFDESLKACEDYDLWLRITSQFSVDYIDKPLITKYGGHNDQLSHKYWGMDRFRIYAMEKLYSSTTLAPMHRRELLRQLVNKCELFARGAQKHGRIDSFKDYSAKANLYKLALNGAMS